MWVWVHVWVHVWCGYGYTCGHKYTCVYGYKCGALEETRKWPKMSASRQGPSAFHLGQSLSPAWISHQPNWSTGSRTQLSLLSHHTCRLQVWAIVSSSLHCVQWALKIQVWAHAFLNTHQTPLVHKLVTLVALGVYCVSSAFLQACIVNKTVILHRVQKPPGSREKPNCLRE